MAHDGNGSNGFDAPDYSAHPYLDPQLLVHEPSTFRDLYRQYIRIRKTDDIYNSFLNKLLWIGRKDESLAKNLAETKVFLSEVDTYIGGLIELLPDALRADLTPLPEVERTDDVRGLMSQIFARGDARCSFEAQRKLYLAKLFYDIDQTWSVQRGPVHRRYFESLMDEHVFRDTLDERDLEICFNMRADGRTMDYSVGRVGPDQECWDFQVRDVSLAMDGEKRPVRIYFYSCRFKREVIPYQYQRGLETYRLRPVEIWRSLKTARSGSILSKMIRKGESNPAAIEDILGAMFIVQDLGEVETLKQFLMDMFCGPLRFRHTTDTLHGDRDRKKLNPYSAPGYKVYKAEVDLLHPGNPPYFFTVELQIYTLESYLRTIHTDHYASHQSFKKRQFLRGLLPYVFPLSVYGTEAVREYLDGEAPDDAPRGEMAPS